LCLVWLFSPTLLRFCKVQEIDKKHENQQLKIFVLATSLAMTTPTLTNPSITAAICALEHRAWAALCKSGEELLPLLAANPVMIFPGNFLLTTVSSPSVREMLQGSNFTPWKSYTLSHDEVLPLGTDSALIYYRVEATRGEETFRAICSSAWILDGEDRHGVTGGWKMASHQQTLI
jgi:hypothetical protein